MNFKLQYNKNHKSLLFKIKDYALLRLHRKYNIFSIKQLKFKFNQQYVDCFKMLKKIDRLIYRLKLFFHWRVHSVFTITQLKSCSNFKTDFYHRRRIEPPNSIFVEKNIFNVKFYELKFIVDHRQTVKRDKKILNLMKTLRFKKWCLKKSIRNEKCHESRTRLRQCSRFTIWKDHITKIFYSGIYSAKTFHCHVVYIYCRRAS